MFNGTVKGDKLVVEIPLQTPSPSTSGKTLVVATTSGFQLCDAKVNGKPVKVSLTAIIAKD